MLQCDALIVGGGPAGSTCALGLRLAGFDVIVIDRARFPRDKVCGGWVTPEVFPLLDLDPAEYRATRLTLQEITGFRTSVIGSDDIETRYARVVSYAIRRCEFDDFLLRRARVRVFDDTPLTTLRRHGDTWIANDHIETPVVVGAGGHFCPVARHLQGTDRIHAQPVIAKEVEFSLDGRLSSVAADTPELFFCRDLEGYGWCVRKDDFLNVGIGRRERGDFAAHVRDFMSFLVGSGRLPETARLVLRGHAYHAMGTGVRPLAGAGVLLAGDAAGLAYSESGEGIRPAIESGRLAASTLIAANGRYGLDDVAPYANALRTLHRPAIRTPPPLRPGMTALGRALLHSAAFTRYVMLDRWFLRAERKAEQTFDPSS
jgi:geranylgeranyl reductase family protein